MFTARDSLPRKSVSRTTFLHSPFRTVIFAGYRRAVLGRGGHVRQDVSHLGSSCGIDPRPERQDQLPLGTVSTSIGAGARLDLLVQWFA